MVLNLSKRDLTIRGGGRGGKGWYCNCEWTLGDTMLKKIFIQVDI